MDAGVRIHEWTANVLHAKTAVIDGRHVGVGSFASERILVAP